MNKTMYIIVGSNMKGISSAFLLALDFRPKNSVNHFHVFRWIYDTVGMQIQ